MSEMESTVGAIAPYHDWQTIRDEVRLSPVGEERAARAADAWSLFADLMHAGLPYDAIGLFTWILPPRQAIWWGILVCWDSRCQQPLKPPEYAALEAAVNMLCEPDPTRAQEIDALAAKAGRDNRAGALADATFLLPAGESEALTPQFDRLVAVLVRTAIMDAIGAKSQERIHQYLAVGFDIATGRNHWKQ